MALRVWNGSSYIKADIPRVGTVTPKAGYIWDGSKMVKVWPERGYVGASSTFSSITTPSLTAGSSNRFTANVPADSQSGDLLIAQFSWVYSATFGTCPVTAASGWTILSSYRPGLNTPPINISTLWGWHTGASTVNFLIDGNSGSAGGCHVGMVAIRGATGIASSAGDYWSAKATSTLLPSRSVAANQMVVYGLGGVCDESVRNDATWPTLTEAVDIAGVRDFSGYTHTNGVTMAYSGITSGAGSIQPTVNTTTERLHRAGAGVVIQMG